MAITVVPITTSSQWLEMRKPNVGCSEVAALFGIHEYLTGYQLAARKLGKLEDERQTGAMERGHLLEPPARILLHRVRPDWEQIAAGDYYCDRDLRFGCTPDLFVKDELGRTGLIQIKSAAPWDIQKKWRNPDTGEPECPLWIALQAMGEMHLTNADFAAVAVVVVNPSQLSLEVIDVPYLPKTVEEMRRRVEAFWVMVDKGELPDPDYGRDGASIARVYAQVEPDTELDLTSDNELPEIVEELVALRMAKSTADERIKEINAQILDRLKHAERARYAGGVITAKMVNVKEHQVKASSHRRVNIKREQAA